MGKTIERVEIGMSGVDAGYSRDAVVLHFTDGSSAYLVPWCNVGNWERGVSGFRRADLDVAVDVDFIPSGKSEWAPGES